MPLVILDTEVFKVKSKGWCIKITFVDPRGFKVYHEKVGFHSEEEAMEETINRIDKIIK